MLWGGSNSGLEVRTSKDGFTVLRGRFPYSVATVLCENRREIFEPRAFGEALKGEGDILFLAHHDMEKPLASRKAGSLVISDNDDALTFEARLSPEMQKVGYAADFMGALGAGLVGGVSPGFTVPNGGDYVKRDGDGLMRVVRSANLVEISAVTKPAYPASQIEGRNWKPETPLAGKINPAQRWRA